jgi:hypothetical protein
MALFVITGGGIIFARPDFQSEQYSWSAAEYLRMPAYAFSASLAGAVSAWTEDVAGVQYNPSILDNVDTSGYLLSASYTFWTPNPTDRRFLAADFAAALGEYLVLGLSGVSMFIQDFEARDEMANLSEDPSFNSRENSLALTLAGRLQWGIAVGGRVRYLYQELELERANGVGFDLGATYKPYEFLTVGLSGLSGGSKMWWSTGSTYDVLPQGRLGICGRLLGNTLTIEGDMARALHQPTEFSMGVQYKIMDIIMIRAGALSAIDIGDRSYLPPEYHFGLGLRFDRYGFDYGTRVGRASSDLGYPHTLSLFAEIPGF